METRIIKAFKDNNLNTGRLISHSKSEYRDKNKNSVCFFNANIVTINDGKIWYGDLDLTKESDSLKAIATELGVTLYVLKELDCRFEDEGKDGTELIKKAVWDTTQETPFK